MKGCASDNLKKVTSGEIAGGFVGETSRAYLVDAKVNSVLVELLLHVVNALVKLLYLDKAEQVGVIDLGKWFPAIFGKVFDLKVLSEGNVLYVNLFGLKVSVALSKADGEYLKTRMRIRSIRSLPFCRPIPNNWQLSPARIWSRSSLVRRMRSIRIGCWCVAIASHTRRSSRMTPNPRSTWTFRCSTCCRLLH